MELQGTFSRHPPTVTFSVTDPAGDTGTATAVVTVDRGGTASRKPAKFIIMTVYGQIGHLSGAIVMTMIVNIAEAKAQLSKLIDRVYHGEKIVIAKNNLPIANH